MTVINRRNHILKSFNFPGTVVVEVIPPVPCSVPASRTQKIFKVRSTIESGEVKFKVQRRVGAGAYADLAGFGTTASPLTITSTAPVNTTPTPIAVATDDELLVKLEFASASAAGLVITLYIEEI